MKKYAGIIAGILLFLVALGFTLYPLISDYVNTKYESEVHTVYEQSMEKADDTTLEQQRTAAISYNQMLANGVVDPFSQEGLQNAAVDYDDLLNINGDSIMGYIQIPKIDVELPIFHGTDSQVLDQGVGHLLGSSLPVGGGSTHCVLSAHSGMASRRMFTDLDQLEQGDVFYLQVLGEILAYQVDAIEIVLPEETELLQVTPNADYCTLVTCTPYGVNTHRLLVRGTRISYEEAEEIQEETMAQEVQSTWQQQYLRGIVIGLICVLGLCLEFLIAWILWRRRNG